MAVPLQILRTSRGKVWAMAILMLLLVISVASPALIYVVLSHHSQKLPHAMPALSVAQSSLRERSASINLLCCSCRLKVQRAKHHPVSSIYRRSRNRASPHFNPRWLSHCRESHIVSSARGWAPIGRRYIFLYRLRRSLVSIWQYNTHIFISVYSAGPDNVYHLPFLCHHPYYRPGNNPKLENHTNPPNEHVGTTPIYPVIRHETDLPIVNRESDAYIATVIGATKNSLQSMNQVFIIEIGDIAGNGESDA